MAVLVVPSHEQGNLYPRLSDSQRMQRRPWYQRFALKCGARNDVPSGPLYSLTPTANMPNALPCVSEQTYVLAKKPDMPNKPIYMNALPCVLAFVVTGTLILVAYVLAIRYGMQVESAEHLQSYNCMSGDRSTWSLPKRHYCCQSGNTRFGCQDDAAATPTTNDARHVLAGNSVGSPVFQDDSISPQGGTGAEPTGNGDGFGRFWADGEKLRGALKPIDCKINFEAFAPEVANDKRTECCKHLGIGCRTRDDFE